MRFLFVDLIEACDADRIVGRKTFASADPMQYLEPGFDPMIAPGVICEAMGQLASWLCLQRTDFTMRPVFLFADSIQNFAEVRPGDPVRLEARFHDFASDSCRFSANAHVGDTLVQTLDNCAMSFIPLAELEDPLLARQRFEALSTGGLTYPDHEGAPFAFRQLIDQVLIQEASSMILVEKRFAEDEAFYPDHFPRFPVTPVVMLNEMIGQAHRRLLGLDAMSSLKVRRIDTCKIRNFVRPGESCQARIKVLKVEQKTSSRWLTSEAEILKDNKRILRATWQLEWEGAHDHV